MSEIITLLSLPPIFRGFIGMIISGLCFPLTGVMILRLKLIPLRYMLMHGVLLGGAIALASSLPLIPVIILTNILLVFLMVIVSKNQSFGFSGGSAALMVISMALSSIITHIKDVPAKDSLNLLWGSPFALSKKDIVLLFILLICITLFLSLTFKNILSLFYNEEIAISMGIKVNLFYYIIVFIIALVVAFGMKLLGAFLIDALLILPVLTASSFLHCFIKKSSVKKLFIYSSLTGLIMATVGYLISLRLDWPPSGGTAIISGVLFIFISIIQWIKKWKKEN